MRLIDFDTTSAQRAFLFVFHRAAGLMSIKEEIFPQPCSQQEYPECDGIRGVAILLVFFFHYIHLFGIENSQSTSLNLPFLLSFSGAYGVQFFFILSAYLLFFPQFSKIVDRKPVQSVRDFSIRRFFRIAPLYYLLILFVVYSLYIPSHIDFLSPHNYHHVLSHQFFIHFLSAATRYSLIDVAWSVGVEAIFYVFLACFIYFLKECSRYFSNRTLYFIVAFPLPFVLYVSFTSMETGTVSIISFFIGMNIAALKKKFHDHSIARGYLTLISCIILFLILFVFYQIHYKCPVKGPAFHPAFISGIPFISLLFGIAILTASKKDKLFYPFFAFYPLRLVGLFSYEFYLVHLFILNHIKRNYPDQSFSSISVIVVIVSLTFLISGALHFVISRPFVKISAFLTKNKNEQVPLWMKTGIIILFLSVLSPAIDMINRDTPNSTGNVPVAQSKNFETEFSQLLASSLFNDPEKGRVLPLPDKEYLFANLHNSSIAFNDNKWFITTNGIDPYFILNKNISFNKGKKHIIKLNINCSQNSFLQVFYASDTKFGFSEDHSLEIPLEKGEKNYYVTLNADIALLRFDMGSGNNNFLINSFTIKEF